MPPSPLLPRLLEVSQIWWRLVLTDRHQQAVTTQVVAFRADGAHRRVLGAVSLGPVGARTRITHILLIAAARPRQCMVEDGDLVRKDVRMGLGAADPLLECGLSVESHG